MIKDVLVHLDGSPEDECRLAYAAMVASLSRQTDDIVSIAFGLLQHRCARQGRHLPRHRIVGASATI